MDNKRGITGLKISPTFIIVGSTSIHKFYSKILRTYITNLIKNKGTNVIIIGIIEIFVEFR